MTSMQIEIIKSGDNYIYLIIDGSSAAVVDPSEAENVLTIVRNAGLDLSTILITHDHHDHTAGVKSLRNHTNCMVYGPSQDCPVKNGQVIHIGITAFSVISVPGHTSNDVAYYSAEASVIFTGDTLFGAGCGRIFGGSAEQMWNSLQILRNLPNDTLIYCGHEYTVANLEFAISIEPHNNTIAHRLTEERKRQKHGTATIPTTMALEKITNPFLRCDDTDFKKAVGLSDRNSTEVFAEIRKRKNSF